MCIRDSPYAYGIPVLFPANRIAGGEYSYDGVTYRFPQNYPNGVHIHGVVHNRAWRLAETETCDGEARATFELSTKDPSLRTHFPIDLTLRLKCVLNKNGLLQRFVLCNESDVTMPFGLAYHTAFRVPFVQGGQASDVRLRLPLEGLCADDPVDRLPSGNVRPLSRYESGFTSPAGEDPLKAPLDALYKACLLYTSGKAGFAFALAAHCRIRFPSTGFLTAVYRLASFSNRLPFAVFLSCFFHSMACLLYTSRCV